jgi:8-oxo-dGTP diphosphatase
MGSRFNVRVYGLWLHEGKVLVNGEDIRGKLITKFPGGGLELGEGIADCLRREWMEELGLPIEVGDLFYINDFYQKSAYDDSQIISIYYRVSANPHTPWRNLNPNERTYWMPLAGLEPDFFTLPIDRMVAGRLSAGGFTSR